jgi:hypothetical protein
MRNTGSKLETLDIYGFEGFAFFEGVSAVALLEHASALSGGTVGNDGLHEQQGDSTVPPFRLPLQGGQRDPDDKNLFLDTHDIVSSDWGLHRVGGVWLPD